MTPRAIRLSAVAGLALAIALLALSLASGLRSTAINGPQALGATPRGEVWFGVDQELWRATTQGRLIAATPVGDLGLPGPPSNLVRQPDGRLVATVRDDPRLFVLDPATARVVRAITPRWPEDLKAKGRDAINVAFAPDGRIAIATGGGHTVALFDPDGAFLARTAPGTYRFTNGLWWTGEALWTTDTNRTTLRRLDGRTLAVQQSLALSDRDDALYLGPARAISADDATIALIRFRGGMIRGRVVIVNAEGEETALPAPPGFEPTDVDWVDQHVLATDGAAMAVHRWSVDGQVLSDFGDDAFARRLRDVGATRTRLWRLHEGALRVAIPVFAVAFLLALLARRREGLAAAAASRLDLSHLGTPQPGNAALIGLSLRILWPLLAMLAGSQLPRLAPVRRWFAAATPDDLVPRVAMIAAIAIAWALVAVVVVRVIRRRARLQEFEPVMNGTAMRRLLATPADQLPLADGEHLVETFMLVRQTGRGGFGRAAAAMRWGVCTNQGVRLFRVAGRSQWLDEEFALADVVDVSTEAPPRSETGWSPAWVARRTGRGAWLAVTLRDGRVVQGVVTSLTVHARLVRFFSQPNAQPPATPRAAVATPVLVGPTRGRAALASALLPGLGQWWQRRGGMGLLYFVPWAIVVLAFSIPIAWTLLGARADVSSHRIALAFGMQLAYTVLAAWDAWLVGRPRLPDAAR
jgi:hypothetical protein